MGLTYWTLTRKVDRDKGSQRIVFLVALKLQSPWILQLQGNKLFQLSNEHERRPWVPRKTRTTPWLLICKIRSDQISRSVMSNSATPWIAACQASLSITNSRGSLRLTSISQWCHPAISSSASPSPPVPNPSQHQSLFQWVNSSHEVAKVLEFQL